MFRVFSQQHTRKYRNSIITQYIVKIHPLVFEPTCVPARERWWRPDWVHCPQLAHTFFWRCTRHRDTRYLQHSDMTWQWLSTARVTVVLSWMTLTDYFMRHACQYTSQPTSDTKLRVTRSQFRGSWEITDRISSDNWVQQHWRLADEPKSSFSP